MTRQPAGKQETAVAAAKAKAMVMAMAMAPVNERQIGGEAPVDKRRRGHDRPRLCVERRRQSQEDERRRH